MIGKAEQQYLFDWAKDIGETHQFVDFHVHPFDVYSCDTNYQSDRTVSGLFNKASSVYKPPTIEFKTDDQSKRNAVQDNNRAILLASRLIYSHTGSKVITDQLDLAGIAGALLLPIVRNPVEGLSMMDAMKKMFLEEPRLYQACPFPVGIALDTIFDYYKNIKKVHKVYAIKIHPNLLGMDPFSKTGKELIESTLLAASDLKLPVVVHGGFTAGLSHPEHSRYSSLERLESINWNLSSCPVVIAHAGCYGLAEGEISSSLQILNRMMEKNPYLLADTSALSLPALKIVFSKVSHNRLIFGSDALYFSIWGSWLNFLQVLRALSQKSDDDLIRIASQNPRHCLEYAENTTYA